MIDRQRTWLDLQLVSYLPHWPPLRKPRGLPLTLTDRKRRGRVALSPHLGRRRRGASGHPERPPFHLCSPPPICIPFLSRPGLAQWQVPHLPLTRQEECHSVSTLPSSSALHLQLRLAMTLSKYASGSNVCKHLLCARHAPSLKMQFTGCSRPLFVVSSQGPVAAPVRSRALGAACSPASSAPVNQAVPYAV